VIAHRQLRALGFSAKAIKHRLRTGRLRQIWRGVYAVGRPSLTDEGWWMGAVLACGDRALLSHCSAAALWGLRAATRWPIHVSVPRARDPSHDRVVVHRRSRLDKDAQVKAGIPVTGPVQTLIDLACHVSEAELERAVNEADKLDLIDPETLRASLDRPRGPGVGRLKKLLDNPTFVLTDSELERRFARISETAGLPKPETQAVVNGHRVDFFYRDLGLVVETDGLRYHRTPTQQSRDRVRDQAHAAAGLTVLRFTHAQVRYEPDRVADTLARTATARGRAAPRGRGARRRPPSPPGRAGSA
jgi:very-short-patch-repair endonuclease